MFRNKSDNLNSHDNNFHKKFNRMRRISIAMFIVIGFFIVAGIGVSVFALTKTQSHSACVVTDADRVMTQEGNSEMRVYTDNCGTFTANDSLFDMKFDSSELYGQLKEGGTFDLETRGIRIPILSKFENIITATPTQQ